jgi:STE24 endopeptidase
VSAGRRRLLGLAALAAGAVAWTLAARWLWHSTVPPGLRPPRLDPRASFSRAFLARSAFYERFLAIDALLAALVLLGVLAIYARRGARLMRESAAGPIGTGMMLGMLGLGIVWLAELPFGLAAVWWERRHHVSHQGYLASVLQGFLSLGGTFLSVSLALLIAMALARWLRRWWWFAGAPLFAGIALLLTFLSIYLIPDVHPLRSAPQLADARALARREGVAGTRVEVQDVARFTTAPNAEAVGFGSTRRVILWDTLLDGRFSRRQLRIVMAHELGHVSRDHPLKAVGWLALFLLPALGLIALATRRRGGLARPEAVPVALFVLIALNVVTMPLRNVVSRHVEAEADWIALQATHDPSAAREAFRRLATTSLADPDPPTWVYVLDEDHPTIMQRIAATHAWRP